MVEHSPLPAGRCVTKPAIRGEAGRHMIRIRRLVKVDRMTGSAIRGGACELAIDMALGALDFEVGTRQRKHGL